jgi:phosphate transport system permease protein
MALDLEPPPTRHPAPLGSERQPGSFTDSLFRIVALLSGLLVLAVLGLILYSTTNQAWAAFQHEGIDFLTQNAWYPSKLEFGALSLIWGTLLISVIALVMAVPVSIGIALFITEIAPTWMRKPVVYGIDLLATIPSVVYGLWGLLVFAPAVLGFYQNLADWFSGVPLLGTLLNGTPVSARSFMTAGIILAIMVVPIVTSISREVFATTPVAMKEASLALGATRWEMIHGSVLPHGRNGVVSAILIGLGRAIGETIAVVLVIGSVQNEISLHLFNAGDSMASVIVTQFGEAQGLQRSALIGLGVILFLVTVVVGIIARLFIARSDRRLGVPGR